MITGKKMVVLADIKSVLDPNTGDRVKEVEHAKKLVSTVELVGINTAQLGQSQGFNLAYSVIVNRVHYSNEKYLYFDNTLYEIKSISKAKSPTEMLLNVQRLTDGEIKDAIEKWLNPEEPTDPEEPTGPEEVGDE